MNKRKDTDKRGEHEPRKHEEEQLEHSGRETREHERKEHEHGEHEYGEHEHHRPRGTGFGRERKVYLEYLLRRWQGSPPPTAEAYARALQQWRQLPGALATAPSDLGAASNPAPAKQPPSTPVEKGRRS